MPAVETTQRRRSNRRKATARVVRLQLKDRLGNLRLVTADLSDLSDDGIGILIMAPLTVGSTILIRGNLGDGHVSSERQATVKWCVETNTGGFHAGLEFDVSRPSATAPPPQSRLPVEEADWYEVMQLSPNADSDTIGRVYRILAQRYHPDAPTGNQEAFVRLCEAHRILSDPQLRASYDARHREAKQLHWEIFDRPELPGRQEAEQRKRQAILEALYAKTLVDPERATMVVQDLETLLGCPREHLEAALWYLRAKNYLKRSDSGRFSITVTGFDEVESRRRVEEMPHNLKMLEGGARR